MANGDMFYQHESEALLRCLLPATSLWKCHQNKSQLQSAQYSSEIFPQLEIEGSYFIESS